MARNQRVDLIVVVLDGRRVASDHYRGQEPAFADFPYVALLGLRAHEMLGVGRAGPPVQPNRAMEGVRSAPGAVEIVQEGWTVAQVNDLRFQASTLFGVGRVALGLS